MAHVIVVGAGAIGSHVLGHVARMRAVTRVTVIDPQAYAADNAWNQDINSIDVGKSKAQAQVRRMKRIRHDVAAAALQLSVEAVPLGCLRADVILGCVDSRRARMAINQAAWRLGVPWIDAGIDASGLVRVQAFVPAGGGACLECAWSVDDYALVEQAYPCMGDPEVPPSSASSSLGALAAALQAVECEKLLVGEHAYALVGRDLLIDVRHHRHFVTSYAASNACRMPDHCGWQCRPLDLDPASATVTDLLAGAWPGPVDRVEMELGVAGCTVALAATCQPCGVRTEGLAVLRAGQSTAWPCPHCGGLCSTSGFDTRDAVAIDALPPSARATALSILGITAHDVVTVGTRAAITRLELGGSA